MTFSKLALVLFCSSFVCMEALAQRAHTPAAGTEERAAIMDALREPVERDLKQKVIFKVDRLRVAGDWAYVRVSPTKPSGDEIDFSKTKYREQVEEGMFDPQGEALLRLQDDGWKVVEWVFGGTDVASAEWGEKYDLPNSLLQ
jgi:hypothetical protein